MTSATTFLKTRRRGLLWLAGILASYSLLGFLFIPWLVESQLSRTLEQRLSLRSELGSVYFNPFSFYFELEDLRLSDPERDNLFELASLQVNFQASRLALLKLQFSEINIDGLDAYYWRSAEEGDTVASLTQRWLSSAESAAEAATEEEPSELIALEILNLSLSNISLHVLDEAHTTPFVTTMVLAEAQIENISTLPDTRGNNSLTLNFEQGAQLEWTGSFSVNPLSLNGELALSDFSLLPVSRYFEDTLPLRIEDGRVMLSLSYDVDLSQDVPRFKFDQIDIALSQLVAIQNGAASPFMEATRISLNGGLILIPENRAEFDTLNVNELNVTADRDESGLVNIQAIVENLPIVAAAPTQDSPEEPPSDGVPWFASLNTLRIENNRHRFTDNSLETPFTVVTTVNTSLSDIDNQAGSRFPLTTNIRLESGGEIELQGQLQVIPELDLSSNLSISGLAIELAQPYINEFALIELERGTVDLAAELLLSAAEPFSYRGGIALSNVEISDLQLNETLISMDSLNIDAIDFSLANNSIDVSEVLFDSLFARVVVNEDSSNNISRSIRPSPEASTDSINAPTTPTDPLAITVGKITLQDASANFTDKNLPLMFNAKIQGLNGSVEGFANNSSQTTAMSLEGQVGEFGLVKIDSTMLPFDFSNQSSINLSFTNLDMPSLTPYVIKFAGREISEGSVDVDLSYELEGGELTANNQMILSQLVLGDRREHPGAMDLPLDLAIALLQDGNGIIDLEVSVNGNVNDPEFDFGPAIRRALSNILTNIVAAPFHMLGNLIGGGDGGRDLETIRFLPGRSDLTPPEQEVLLLLSEALLLRPQLQLEIPSVSSGADVLALQTQAIDEIIDAALGEQAPSDASLTARRQLVVEILYTNADMLPGLPEIQATHTPTPEQPTDSSTAAAVPILPAELDTLAYIADLRGRLIASTEVNERQLSELATARSESVVDYLTSNGGIAADRLDTGDLASIELDDDGWLLMQFGVDAK